jgi:hypothetical protein
VPEIWSPFQGYNDVKRKKVKAQQMSESELRLHVSALYSLAMKPYMKTPAFLKIATEITNLATCMEKYADYLQDQLKKQNANQSMMHPVRMVETEVSIEYRQPCSLVKEDYTLFEKDVLDAGLLKPVQFDENVHYTRGFETPQHRYRFIANMHLSIPIEIVKYSPGGSSFTSVFAYQVDANRSADDEKTQSAQVVASLRPKLKEYHTRAMKKEFKARVGTVVKVSGGTLEHVYQELTNDASAHSHPDIAERIRLITLGETGLVADLRTQNAGRPNDYYDVFFEKMAEVIEDVVAADERRHNTAHLSEWVSLPDLISKCTERCPEGTPIPSKSLVRLQFTPRNPYAHTALKFTSRFDVQYKIQRRQIRASHPDAHYCAAQLKYLKAMAVDLKSDAVLIFCDDKAKIPFGEPGHILSTGVRGRSSLCPSETTLASEDHDVHHKGSLTPSVYLKSEIPSDVNKSFCRGQVLVTVNDSIFQASSPMRHAATVLRELAKGEVAPVFLKFSDGGTDQRNNLESVKCSLITVFKKLDLDMVVACRCAPGQSWCNTAERVMSILNIALQNCALEREKCSEDTERLLRSCSSGASIRAEKDRSTLVKEWSEVVGKLQKTVGDRFSRMSLKQKPIDVQDPVEENDIRSLEEMLESLFPGLDVSKLTKQGLKKNQAYQNWLQKHCRERTYSFQIRKCSDLLCCKAPKLTELEWLPDPVLDSSGDHYLPYDQVKGTVTTDENRPSARPAKEKLGYSLEGPAAKKIKKSTTRKDDASCSSQPDMSTETGIFTAQMARSFITCIECLKPRLLYSKYTLTSRQALLLTVVQDDAEFTCGSPLVVSGHPLHNVIHARQPMNCADPVEVPYYTAAFGRVDICAHCAVPDCVADADLRSRFKTVLPCCASCFELGFRPLCYRPYGQITKN